MAIVIFGLIIAILAVLTYTVTRLERAKNEKAALEISKAASDNKIEILQTEALQNEANLRARESLEDMAAHSEELEYEVKFTVRFYPRVSKNPDDHN